MIVGDLLLGVLFVLIIGVTLSQEDQQINIKSKREAAHDFKLSGSGRLPSLIEFNEQSLTSFGVNGDTSTPVTVSMLKKESVSDHLTQTNSIEQESSSSIVPTSFLIDVISSKLDISRASEGDDDTTSPTTEDYSTQTDDTTESTSITDDAETSVDSTSTESATTENPGECLNHSKSLHLIGGICRSSDRSKFIIESTTTIECFAKLSRYHRSQFLL